MRVEAFLSAADLVAVARQFAPVRITLAGEGNLVVSDPSEVTLVPNVGVRIVCKAMIHWPVLGVVVPVKLHSLVVVVRPEIVEISGATALVFKLEIEHADLAGVPTFVDNRITEKVNAELAKNHVELAWKFAKTLSHTFALPKSLAPLEAFALTVIDARVVVTGDAMGLAVAFGSSVTGHRDGAETSTPTEQREAQP